jgi:hypothetical protein
MGGVIAGVFCGLVFIGIGGPIAYYSKFPRMMLGGFFVALGVLMIAGVLMQMGDRMQEDE